MRYSFEWLQVVLVLADFHGYMYMDNYVDVGSYMTGGRFLVRFASCALQSKLMWKVTRTLLVHLVTSGHPRMVTVDVCYSEIPKRTRPGALNRRPSLLELLACDLVNPVCCDDSTRRGGV